MSSEARRASGSKDVVQAAHQQLEQQGGEYGVSAWEKDRPTNLTGDTLDDPPTSKERSRRGLRDTANRQAARIFLFFRKRAPCGCGSDGQANASLIVARKRVAKGKKAVVGYLERRPVQIQASVEGQEESGTWRFANLPHRLRSFPFRYGFSSAFCRQSIEQRVVDSGIFVKAPLNPFVEHLLSARAPTN